MKQFLWIFLSVLTLLFSREETAYAQGKVQNKELDKMIERGIKDWQIPAISVLVVKDGTTLFKKTYGVRNIVKGDKADNETLFTMASTTKALVAMSMAMLVDEGKVNWDDPVKMHYPKFELSDSYIRSDARIKDLFTHNLGIGNADYIWYGNDLSTEEILKKFALRETIYPLRGGYQYQNLGYVIAGEVIKEISGQHWGEFAQERIFQPLGMTRTYSMSKDVTSAGNISTPHFNDLDDGVIPIDYIFFDQAGAAGSIWSCIDDMERYFKFIHHKGVMGTDTLIQPETFEYLFKPKAIIDRGFYPTEELTQPHWKTYGMGWFQHDYKGAKVDFHTGSIDGLVAINGWLRDHDLGVYVFSNLNHAEIRHAIMYKVFDLYALGGDRDWHVDIYDLYNGFRENQIEELKSINDNRIEGTNPSKSLNDYVGTFVNDMNGKVEVTLSDNRLHANSNDKWMFDLNHWHYDTYRSDKHPQWRSKIMVQFFLDQNGDVSRLNFRGIEFDRIADE